MSTDVVSVILLSTLAGLGTGRGGLVVLVRRPSVIEMFNEYLKYSVSVPCGYPVRALNSLGFYKSSVFLKTLECSCVPPHFKDKNQHSFRSKGSYL